MKIHFWRHQKGFEGRIWDLIVSVPDHCLSFYFTWQNDVVKLVEARQARDICTMSQFWLLGVTVVFKFNALGSGVRDDGPAYMNDAMFSVLCFQNNFQKQTKDKALKKKIPVLPLNRPTLRFRADSAIFIAILKKKKTYSPTDPFLIWKFFTKLNENVRI